MENPQSLEDFFLRQPLCLLTFLFRININYDLFFFLLLILILYISLQCQ